MTTSLYEKVVKAKHIINHTVNNNPKGTVGVASAFGRTSLVLLHLVRSSGHSLPIVFADTGYHHPQVLSTLEDINKLDEINLIRVKSKAEFRQFHTVNITDPPPQESGLSSDHDMSSCCRNLKIEPIMELFHNLEIKVCLVGQRAYKHKPCGDEVHFQLPKEISTISPISDFTDQEVNDYMHEYQIIAPNLYYQGHPAIACLPCTPVISRKWIHMLFKRNPTKKTIQDDEARIKRRLEDLGYM